MTKPLPPRILDILDELKPFLSDDEWLEVVQIEANFIAGCGTKKQFNRHFALCRKAHKAKEGKK